MRLAADLYGTRLGIVTAAESNFNLAPRDQTFQRTGFNSDVFLLSQVREG